MPGMSPAPLDSWLPTYHTVILYKEKGDHSLKRKQFLLAGDVVCVWGWGRWGDSV